MYPKIQIPVGVLGLHLDLHRGDAGLGALALCVMAIMVGLYICSPGGEEKEPTWLLLLRITAVCWAVLPPGYFLAEWRLYNMPGTDSFEAFKYDQEKAKDLWAGVGAVLGMLLLKK
jgi:hypothetical protein